MQSSGSLEQPDRQKHERQQHERQRHGGKGNPEWMGNNTDGMSAETGGLSAGARRAQQFEAERQRMKEEWKKQQGQPKDATNQPVCWTERSFATRKGSHFLELYRSLLRVQAVPAFFALYTSLYRGHWSDLV